MIPPKKKIYNSFASFSLKSEIMKAIDEEGNKIYTKEDEPKLLNMKTSELESIYFEMFNNELPEN